MRLRSFRSAPAGPARPCASGRRRLLSPLLWFYLCSTLLSPLPSLCFRSLARCVSFVYEPRARFSATVETRLVLESRRGVCAVDMFVGVGSFRLRKRPCFPFRIPPCDLQTRGGGWLAAWLGSCSIALVRRGVWFSRGGGYSF